MSEEGKPACTSTCIPKSVLAALNNDFYLDKPIRALINEKYFQCFLRKKKEENLSQTAIFLQSGCSFGAVRWRSLCHCSQLLFSLHMCKHCSKYKKWWKVRRCATEERRARSTENGRSPTVQYVRGMRETHLHESATKQHTFYLFFTPKTVEVGKLCWQDAAVAWWVVAPGATSPVASSMCRARCLARLCLVSVERFDHQCSLGFYLT